MLCASSSVTSRFLFVPPTLLKVLMLEAIVVGGGTGILFSGCLQYKQSIVIVSFISLIIDNLIINNSISINTTTTTIAIIQHLRHHDH